MHSDTGIGHEAECVNSCHGEEPWSCAMSLIGYGLCDDMQCNMTETTIYAGSSPPSLIGFCCDCTGNSSAAAAREYALDIIRNYIGGAQFLHLPYYRARVDCGPLR